MKIKRINRRQFLRGLGGAALALPILPSLLPKEAQAGEDPYAANPRFVCFTTQHGGIWKRNMYPSMLADETQTEIYPGHTMREGTLPHFSGNGEAWISPLLRASDTRLTPELASKFSILQGCDIMFYIAHHSGGYLGNYGRNDGNGGDLSIEFRPTIDQVMAWSPSFYPDIATIKQRSIHVGGGGGRGISWGYANPVDESGAVESLATESSSLELFNRLFDSVINNPNSPRTPVVDRVLEHYQYLDSGRWGESRRLSYADRQKLTAHMDRISELQQRLGVVVSCDDLSVPTDDASNGDPGVSYATRDLPDARRHYQLYNDVIAAAFMCNVCRVATINITQQLSIFDGDWHQNIAHQGHLGETLIEIHEQDNPENIIGTRIENPQQELVDSHRYAFEHMVLDLIEKLDVEEANGVTFLDNSLVMWTQESGPVTHDSYSMPLVLAGSAAGVFNTGKLYDYRNLNDDRLSNPIRDMDGMELEHWAAEMENFPGVPYNRYLATLLQACNIAPEEFERPGETGYGDPYRGLDSWRPGEVNIYVDQNYADMSVPLPGLVG